MPTQAKSLAGALFAGALAMQFAAPCRAEVLLGIAVNQANHDAALTALEAATGHKLAIDSRYYGWSEFPNMGDLAWDKAHGHIPMLSWRVVFGGDNRSSTCASAIDIAGGKYDAQLARQAAQLKAFGAPVLVRWHYGMTGINNEVRCFTGFAVNADREGAGRKYVQAWRHIVDAFRRAGATNVKWVWAPAILAFENYDRSPSDKWKLFYPGDAYVDWIAEGAYNMSNVPKAFDTEPDVRNFYAATASRGKPLMIAETGANSDPRQTPDAQALWLSTMQQSLKSQFPKIRAVVYWEPARGPLYRDNPGYGGSGYILEGQGLEAFKRLAADPYFAAMALH
jgi:hypothetical protein